MNRRKREQQILDAAAQFFSKSGYSQANVSEIINVAHVARGTFYLHFKSKGDLFSKILDRFFSEVTRDVSMMNILHGDSSKPIAKNIRELSSDLISTLTQNRSLLKLILIEQNQLDVGLHKRIKHYEDQLLLVIMHNLQDGIREGVFQPCQPYVVSRSILGGVKELIIDWVTRGDLELESALEGFIDYHLHGLVDRGTSFMVSKEPAELAQRSISNLH